MSVDAGLYLRWPHGQAPSAEELAEQFGITSRNGSGIVGKIVSADGHSRMWITVSTDPRDLVDPSRTFEHAYDHWLSLSPSKSAPYPEDTFAVLRAQCRQTVTRLRRTGLVESAFYVDADSLTSYWTDTRSALGPEPLPAVELDLWWAAETPTTSTLPAALTPNLHPAPADPARTTVLIPVLAEASGILWDIAHRAGELPVRHTARFTGHHVTPEELDAFSDRLAAELARPGEQIDVALWANGRLCRYEVANQPVTDLRVC
ncbi:hypothetical protein GCM10018790_65940 [Kitasatospora xanthocidica]|uniref:hypothetical protein n=1 Tax=Kitasatospora xanthocidica TaxID=83382 RepID=UPI001673D6C1|nr:hypothetical protein [Kitasatospora xanthocidica]GHF78752.1 hypothetical protein GCM10018790_65940 [Kitasatospora xanthocidica]